MRFYILFSLFLCSVACFAQTDWAPVGAKWHYNFEENDFTTIESIGDTIIQNKNCTILKLNHTWDSLKICTFNEDNKVWYFKSGKFYKLYDFAAKVGDTWQVVDIFNLCGADSLVNIIVDSIGTTLINGNLLKHIVVRFTTNERWGFHCYGDVGFSHKIIEHIGALGYMFPRRFCALDYPYPCDLRCYSDEQFGLYETGIVDSCNYVKDDAVIISQDNSTFIYPNPTEKILNIELGSSKPGFIATLYNLFGEKVMKLKLDEQIKTLDLSELEEGYYILQIFKNKNYSFYKILKQ